MLHGLEQPAEDANKADATEQVAGNGETRTEQAGESADGAEPEKALAASEPAPLPETVAAEKVAQESIVAEVAARDGEPAIAIGDDSPQADDGMGCVGIPEAAAAHSQSDQPPSSEQVTPAVAESSTSAGADEPTMDVPGGEQSSPPAQHRSKSWFARLFPS